MSYTVPLLLLFSSLLLSSRMAGRIYQLGLHGVRRDMAAAADHFERASSLGHPGALGACV